MNYKIRNYEDNGISFAEVVNEKGESICVAEGSNELESMREVCLVFADIIDNFQKEYYEIKNRIIDEVVYSHLKGE